MQERLEISPSTRETHRSDFKSSPVYSSSDVTRSLQTVYSKTTHWVSESMTPCCCLETRTDWRHHVIAVHVINCRQDAWWAINEESAGCSGRSLALTSPLTNLQYGLTAHSNGRWPFHRIIWLYTQSLQAFFLKKTIMILMTSIYNITECNIYKKNYYKNPIYWIGWHLKSCNILATNIYIKKYIIFWYWSEYIENILYISCIYKTYMNKLKINQI